MYYVIMYVLICICTQHIIQYYVLYDVQYWDPTHTAVCMCCTYGIRVIQNTELNSTSSTVGIMLTVLYFILNVYSNAVPVLVYYII